METTPALPPAVAADSLMRELLFRQVPQGDAARLADITEASLRVGITPRKTVDLIREYTAQNKLTDDLTIDGALAATPLGHHARN